MNIYQNDQYYIKIKIKFNGEVVDDTTEEVAIKVGDVILKKSLNQISYDTENECWLFPLTIDQSSNAEYVLQVQCWFSNGDDYRSTPVETIVVKNSIIEKSEVVND